MSTLTTIAATSRAWRQTKLATVLTQNNRRESVVGTRTYKLLGVRLAGQGPFLREEKIGQRIQASHLSQVKAGDFIYSRLFAWRGAFGVIPRELDGAYVSNEFPTFTADANQLDVNFLRLYFSRPAIWSQVESFCTGTTKASRNRFKEQFFEQMEIPLPPLNEQRRIVFRVEELAAKAKEAFNLRNETVAETESLEKAYFEKVLGSRTWPQRTVDELVGQANLRNGRSVKSHGVDSGVFCLRLSAMRDGRIDLDDCKPIPLTREEATAYLVKERDVFVVRGNGSKELVGRAGLVESERTGVIFPDLFIQIPLDEKRVLPEFFVAVWNARRVRNAIREKAKTTSGIWKINQHHIASVSIPLPPLHEQRQIVSYLNDLQAKVEALKKLQFDTAAELDALMPSILDKAFRGEL